MLLMTPDLQRVAHALARRVISHENMRAARQNAPASYRPGKRAQALEDARSQGVRDALAIVLGLPEGSHRELDEYLARRRAVQP
jgi:hypothetical protein